MRTRPLFASAVALSLFLAILGSMAPIAQATPQDVIFSQPPADAHTYDVVEFTATVSRPDAANPFTDVQITGQFTPAGGEPVKVDGFCDANDGSLFCIRFMPSKPGEYAYTIRYVQDQYVKQSSGTFSVRQGAHAGPVRVDPQHPFHFVREGTDQHWFWNATTTYQILAWDDETIAKSIDRLANLGVNRIRVALAGRTKEGRRWNEPLVVPTEKFKFRMEPWPAARPDNFEDPGYDVSRFNLEHYRKAERLLRLARERNVIVSLIFYVDGADKGVDPFGKQRMGGAEEQRYYRYTIARLAPFANIMWDVTNEYRLFRDDPWAEKMGAFVKECDPYDHLTSTHGHGDFRFRTSQWADFAMYQSWDEDGGYKYMLKNRRDQLATGRPMPQVNEEYGYEDHYPTGWGGKRVWPTRNADSRRRLAWEISMAGCYQTTGERADDGTGAGPDTGGGWINGRGNEHMTMLLGYRHMVNFFTSIPWWTLEPREDLAGDGTLLLADPGKRYVAYLPRSASARFTLAAGTYHARWFNCRTGEWTELPDVRQEKDAPWTSSKSLDAGDWALLLEAKSSLEPSVLLPDGTEFKTWEQPLRFDRTYYVDASNPIASDANPGTADRPFATINRAARVLQPGERVVVGAGVYREWVRPARGGSGPGRMISYEAAPGATVVIKGSCLFKPSWIPSTAVTGNAPAKVWQARLDPTLFDGYNPFAIDNVTKEQFDVMDWAEPLRGKAPYTLPRGLVFQGEKLLRQVTQAADLLTTAGAYWVDRAQQVLHVRPIDDQLPQQATFEITTQETVFAPTEAGLGYIRVKGFTIEHAAGPFPWEQVGAISTTRGHHWIIENNTVRWVNGVGIDLGTQHPRKPQPPVIGFHIVRGNVITDCGICGICGLGPGRGREFGLLIEDNVLARNAFYDVERLYETAAIKTHNNTRCVIRRNLIVDTRYGSGIWMDWNNQFSRCSQNIIVGTHTIHGGIFLEASYQPNLVDQNIIWGTDGHGIYEHDCTQQQFMHNLVVGSSKCGLHLHGKITDRRVDGRTMVYGRHVVKNNIVVDNAKADEYLGEPSTLSGNVQKGISAKLDLLRMVLSWTTPDAGVLEAPTAGITHDLLGQHRLGPRTWAGPFAVPMAGQSEVRLWPLVKSSPQWPIQGTSSSR